MSAFVVHQDFPPSCISNSHVFTTTQMYQECSKLCYIYRYFSAGGSGLKTWTLHFIQQISFVAPPHPDIPPRVWAVVLALYLNTINGLTGSGNWVVISNNVSLSVTHISCVPFLEYLTDSKYKNSGHCAVLEECECKFDLQKFQHCVMKWYDWMAI